MPLAPSIVAQLSRCLHAHAGLELPTWVVEARATSRITALGVSPESYVELVTSGRGGIEREALVEAVRVGESSLFRHRAQINALVDVVAPAWRERGKRSVRVWSAGCAAGQEPYTLAIVLSRVLPGVALSVVATDVSIDSIEVARRATYPRADLDDVPEVYRDAFVEDATHVRVRPEIASLVRFEQANLVHTSPVRGCDLVWCRNVLIYFSESARRQALDHLVAATLPGGYVFVGYSESLRDVEGLEVRRAEDVVYYVRRDESSPAQRATPSPRVHATVPRRTPVAGVEIPADQPGASGERLLAVRGTPLAATFTQLIGEQLATPGLVRLVIDLDGADLLDDELAPVVRRARAAAELTGVEVVLRATRTGARRWLVRHGLGGLP